MIKKLRVPSINSITISGRLTKDLEVRYISSGSAVVTLSIAHNRNFKDKNGGWQKEVSFVDVVVWGPRAEGCGKYLHKGDPVLVEGSLRTRTYTNKDGKTVKVTEIFAQRVHFLESNFESDISNQDSKNVSSEGKFKEPAKKTKSDDESVPF